MWSTLLGILIKFYSKNWKNIKMFFFKWLSYHYYYYYFFDHIIKFNKQNWIVLRCGGFTLKLRHMALISTRVRNSRESGGYQISPGYCGFMKVLKKTTTLLQMVIKFAFLAQKIIACGHDDSSNLGEGRLFITS